MCIGVFPGHFVIAILFGAMGTVRNLCNEITWPRLCGLRRGSDEGSRSLVCVYVCV